jgi:hypothetical protein
LENVIRNYQGENHGLKRQIEEERNRKNEKVEKDLAEIRRKTFAFTELLQITKEIEAVDVSFFEKKFKKLKKLNIADNSKKVKEI